MKLKALKATLSRPNPALGKMTWSIIFRPGKEERADGGKKYIYL